LAEFGGDLLRVVTSVGTSTVVLARANSSLTERGTSVIRRLSVSSSLSSVVTGSSTTFNKSALLDAFGNVNALVEVDRLTFTAVVGLFDGEGGGVLAFGGQVRRNGNEEGLVLGQVVSEVSLDIRVQLAVGVFSGRATLNDSLTSNNGFSDSGINIIRLISRVSRNDVLVVSSSSSLFSFFRSFFNVVKTTSLDGAEISSSSRSSSLFSDISSIYTEFSFQSAEIKSVIGVESEGAFDGSDKVFRVVSSELVQVFTNSRLIDFSSGVVVDVGSFQVTSFEDSQTETENVTSVSVVLSSLIKRSSDLLQQFGAVIVRFSFRSFEVFIESGLSADSERISSRDLVVSFRSDEDVVWSDVSVRNIVSLEISAGRGDGVQQVPEFSFREVFFVTSSSGDFLFEIAVETFKEDRKLVEVSAENLVLLAVVTVGSKKAGVGKGSRVSDLGDLFFKLLG